MQDTGRKVGSGVSAARAFTDSKLEKYTRENIV
jgi:hypothetical protein